MYKASAQIRELLNRNYRQVIRIKAQTKDETIDITERDVAQGGFSIDRYCVSGNTVEIGTAIASELTLELDNRDGRFDSVNFEGAELYVMIGVKKWDAYNWEKAQIQYIPCGYFTVDKPARRLTAISLTGLDRMVKFDRSVNSSRLSFPTSMRGLLIQICDICGVRVNIDDNLTNSHISIPQYPEEDGLTYRTLLQWIAEATGTCAYIDWDGELRLQWYEDTDANITLSDRYSSRLEEAPITITGIQINYGNDQTYLAGSDEYAFLIEGNALLQDDPITAVNTLYEKLDGFSYLPFDCAAKPMPYMYPLDIIHIADKNGTMHKSIITNITYTINGITSIKGKGETATGKSYAGASPLTKRQSVIIKKIESEMDYKINSKAQAAISLNEMIVNSLGLYFEQVQQENGSFKAFAYDHKTQGNTIEQNLRDSSIVYTINAGGFAWTDNWDGIDTVWKYGIDKAGNAILNAIYANKIAAECIQAGILASEGGESRINLNDGTFDFGNGKFCMDADGVVKLIGRMQSTDGKFSMAIGDAEIGNGQAFTINKSTIGDIFQAYTVNNADGETGVVWTAPFLNGFDGKERKGIVAYPSQIGLFADKNGYAELLVSLNQNTGEVFISGISERIASLEAKASQLEEHVRYLESII